MAKLLAIDYGTKRCGIAATDNDQIIASGLGTVHSKDLIPFLEEYVEKNKVEAIVIGLPKRLNLEDSHVTQEVIKFTTHLKRKFKGIEIHQIDERFTSKMAFQSMIDSGLKKKDRANKALIDEVSATIILQDFMERRSNGFM